MAWISRQWQALAPEFQNQDVEAREAEEDKDCRLNINLGHAFVEKL